MASLARVGVAVVAWSGVLACQSIISADFGNYRVGGDDEGSGGAMGGRGGEPNGGRGGDANGGSAGDAGNAAMGGAAPGGGTDSGGTGQGGEGMGGEGAVGASAGDAGRDSGPVRVAKVTGGHLHTCALLEGGALKCWGYGFHGETGLDTTNSRGDMFGELGDALPPVAVGAGRIVLDVTAGYNHTCALFDGGEVKCWGLNESGQLGLGDAENRGDNAGEMADLPVIDFGSGRAAVDLAAGAFHTCAVLDDGSVKCWGDNTMGGLGLGLAETPIGDEPDETVDLLDEVDLGGLRAVRVSAGFYSTCALLEDHSVRCWGENTYGELGITGGSRGSSSSDMGSNLPPLELGEDALDVQVGGHFACALLESGNVKCWGHNISGELGLGTDAETVSPPSVNNVALGTGRTAAALAVGQAHTCVLLDTEEVKCWGANTSGGLGIGRAVDSIGTNAASMGDALAAVDLGDEDTVFALGSGASHTCAAVQSSRALKCWGNNDEGQLGLGDKRDRGRAMGDMGNALPFVDLGTTP